MENKIDAFKKSFEMDYQFAGLLHLYARTSNLLTDESRLDVLDYVYDVLIFVERMANWMQFDEENVKYITRICYEELEKIAGERAKAVFQRIEDYGECDPFTYNSLKCFLREYKEMDDHIKSINEP
ncbi:hypothetical protein [Desulfonatronum parangueonense]